MFSTVASLLVASAIGLTVTPAAYDSAVGHERYQITIQSASASPETIHPRLVPDDACNLNLATAPRWASMSGPASLVLAPHASQSFIVTVGQPPPGRSELVALFGVSEPTKTGAGVTANIGAALRFSEPGTTVIPPCPKPKPTSNPKVRTIVVAAKATSNTGLEFAVGGLTALVILLLLAFGWLRLRNRGTHR